MQKEYTELTDKLVDDNLTIYFDTEKDKVYIVQSVDGKIKEDIVHDFKKTSVEKGELLHQITDETRQKILKVYNLKGNHRYEVVSKEEDKIKDLEPDTYQPYFVLATMIGFNIFLSGEPITQYSFTELILFVAISSLCTYAIYKFINSVKRKRLVTILGTKEKLNEYDRKQKSTNKSGCFFKGYLYILLFTLIIVGIHLYIFYSHIEMSSTVFMFFLFLYIPYFICFALFITYMYLYFISFAKHGLGGCTIIFVFIAGLVHIVNIGSNMQEDYYFHTKKQLAESPINFPENIMNTDGQAFIDAARNYGNSEQRCFYFDLQWSIRHSKDQMEKEKYQLLEKRFLQSNSRLHTQQILAYKLHEALLADASRDSILHYFKKLHPGNIYNTDIYFKRISRTINLVTATPEQERKMASSTKTIRRHGFDPRPLSQAIVNSTCFNMDEKTIMIEYIINCFMELATYNRCPETVIQEFKTKVFDEAESDYHISEIEESSRSGSSYIEEKINELMKQMRESNPDWYTNYTPKNWEEFSF